MADTETGKVPELLPCPFCGSVGAFVRNDATNSDATVQCCNVECGVSFTRTDAKTCALLWNRRSSSFP